MTASVHKTYRIFGFIIILYGNVNDKLNFIYLERTHRLHRQQKIKLSLCFIKRHAMKTYVKQKYSPMHLPRQYMKESGGLLFPAVLTLVPIKIVNF